jgi:hypothetical protein
MSHPLRTVRRALYAGGGVAVCLAGHAADAGSQDRPSYPPLDAVLRIERPRLAIGDEDKAGPALFGGILGVATDAQRNVYVLDGTDHTVRAFTATGKHIASAGRRGRGPGDLRDPMGLWHDGASSLYVIDLYDGISVFDTRENTMIYRERFGAELRPVAMCAIGGQLIVGANRNNHILHVLAPDRKVVRSFGDLFRRDTHPEVQAQYNRENFVMACDETRDRIFVAEGHQNIVRAYDTNGRLHWQVLLPEYSGYRAVPHHQLPNAVSKFFGEFSTKTLSRVGPDLLVVQAHRQTHRRDPDRGGGLKSTDHGTVTYVLSASTGKTLTRSTEAPFFLATVAGEEIVAYNDEPYPRVFFARAFPPR